MTSSAAPPPARAAALTDRILDVRPARARWLDGWVAFAALTVPVFAVLYILTVPTGAWPAIALPHAVLLVVFAALDLRLRGSGVRLTRETVEERAYVRSAVHTPAGRVAGAVLIDLYRGTTDGTNRQLFLVDAAGDTLLRMRGQLWAPADLAAVAAFYDVPVTHPAAPMTWKEVRRSRFARNLERWERHPRLVSAVVAVGGLLLAVPALTAITVLVGHGR